MNILVVHLPYFYLEILPKYLNMLISLIVCQIGGKFRIFEMQWLVENVVYYLLKAWNYIKLKKHAKIASKFWREKHCVLES